MPGTKVKVLREKLIEAIQARKQEVIEEHKKQSEEYPDKLIAWQYKTVSTVEKALDYVRQGKDIPSKLLTRWDKDLSLPSKPNKPGKPSVQQYDRDIAVLEMTAEETISITADDFARYIQ